MSAADRAPTEGLPLRKMLARGHFRLVILAVLLAAVTLTVSGVMLIRSHSAANAVLTARTVSYAVEPAVLFDDAGAISDAIETIGNIGGADRIVVTDARGNPLADWETDHDGLTGSVEALVSGALRGPAVVVPVASGGREIGSVTVHGSLADMLHYATTGFIIALCCLGLTIIATRVLARRLEEAVVAPLEHVGEIAHAVRADRTFGRRVTVSGIAEIDRFARDFNALLAELQSWHEALLSENVELARRAEHDALTGLAGRRRFERDSRHIIERARSEGTSFAVLYLDCNDFKAINDDFGHDVGDMVLCAIADRLQNSVGDCGHIYRFGGDEFAVVLPQTGEETFVSDICDSIRDAMAEPFTLALRKERQLSVSLGRAVYPRDGDNWRELLRVADKRMYQEKKNVPSEPVDAS
ncbi:diguanylate cyclase domain-containing protein [Pelagerythrobacter marensis]|uniref:Diguanylate cyclase (GGDEF) domain-containing protein n=1 Tax=Pelagerythrobacter marensis TaxID=543877 RepID=A0A0G3X6M5_9SPHN|nr:diguanylate cyclase [Pelagerythrobacter marensis]AKM06847.1 Diguanylate cyclase (GGDEF) domain-containing protein [Pelagerythrobacter marensis]